MRIKLTPKSPPDEDFSDNPFSSPSSEHRAMKRAREALPETPKRKAKVLERLVKSPTQNKILEKKGVLMTKESRKNLQMGQEIADSLTEQLHAIKYTGGASPSKRNAYGILRSVINKKRNLRVNTALRTKLKVRKMKLDKEARQWWRPKLRKKRKDRIPELLKQKVKEFYLSPQISREVPDKRAAVKIKEGSKVILLQRQNMTMTIDDAYTLYNKMYPEDKIGLTSFNKLRPLQVKKVSETSRRTRKLHSVKTVGKDLQLDTRNISCYCAGCKEGNPICDNKEYVEPWAPAKIQLEKSHQRSAQPTNISEDAAVKLAEVSKVTSKEKGHTGRPVKSSSKNTEETRESTSDSEGSGEDDIVRDSEESEDSEEESEEEDWKGIPPNIVKGNIVVVAYEDDWAVGTVTEVTESCKQVTVDYMQRANKTRTGRRQPTFFWPDRPCVYDVQQKFILCALQADQLKPNPATNFRDTMITGWEKIEKAYNLYYTKYFAGKKGLTH
ncbi:Hypp590 [Branchiostoma lanceolatum]|uniref:Hypp590 protein n=1 Tax=Branchiostoma lanceolatum TaxID=7740 RepID=A0A8J9WDY3_BRALA|nr:Hypp590 [Branchiostoma lanceolatum]